MCIEGRHKSHQIERCEKKKKKERKKRSTFFEIRLCLGAECPFLGA